MKRIALFIASVCVIAACTHTPQQQKNLLLQVEKQLESHPDSALKLLKKVGDSRYFSAADRALYGLLSAQALSKKELPITSDSLLRPAALYFAGHRDPFHAASAYFYLSRYEQYRGRVEKRAHHLLQAARFARQSHDNRLMGIVYAEKSALFEQEHRMDSALHYARLSLAAYRLTGKRSDITICLIDIGRRYFNLKRYDEALRWFTDAERCIRATRDTVLLSSALRYEGLACHYLGDYKRARSLFYHSIRTSTDCYDAGKWLNLGSLYKATGRYDSAVICFRRVIDLRQSTYNSRDSYEKLADIARRQGNYAEAYRFAMEFNRMSDSIRRTTLEKGWSDMENRFQLQLTQNEYQHLQIAHQKSNVRWLILTLVIFLVIIVMLVRLLRRRKQLYRQQQLLLQKEQQLLLQEQEQNRLLSNQLELRANTLHYINNRQEQLNSRMKEERPQLKRSEMEEMIEQDKESKEQHLKALVEDVDARCRGLSQRLTATFAELTEEDIQICCLLVAGIDSNTIARWYGIKSVSFHTRRSRIRKKLDLQKEEELTDFLATF